MTIPHPTTRFSTSSAESGLHPKTLHPTQLLGQVLMDRYRLLSPLGAGGMGTVYVAEHVTLKRQFAVKVLSPQYQGCPDLVERFLREAQAISAIRHDNVVQITDFGDPGVPPVFFVMELLEGEDLESTIEQNGPLGWDLAKDYTLQICRGVGAAHRVGVIHRDLKPANCFRVRRASGPDQIKVLDFGIAKSYSREDQFRTSLTTPGNSVGSPDYMSPELVCGELCDERSDVYGIGITLYELLTGQVPFNARTHAEVMAMHLRDMPRPPSQVAPELNIPPEVDALVLKALEKEPARRHQNVTELAESLSCIYLRKPTELAEQATGQPVACSVGPSKEQAELPAGIPLWRHGLNVGAFAAAGAFGTTLAMLALHPDATKRELRAMVGQGSIQATGVAAAPRHSHPRLRTTPTNPVASSSALPGNNLPGNKELYPYTPCRPIQPQGSAAPTKRPHN